jgi:hypothetical protein
MDETSIQASKYTSAGLEIMKPKDVARHRRSLLFSPHQQVIISFILLLKKNPPHLATFSWKSQICKHRQVVFLEKEGEEKSFIIGKR